MKTIKERAEEYANEGWTLDEAYIACEDGYIKGATELIDKACEWLKDNAYLFVNDNIGSLDDKNLVEQFRKAMKGE